MARDELYIINPTTTKRVAVPRADFENIHKADGWVIDPDGPSAGDADPKTVKAAEKTLDRAAAKRESAAEDAE